MTDLMDRLAAASVVPLIQAENPDIACNIAKALANGGLTVAEVVFRTDAARDCLARIATTMPDTIVGAGTVLTADQCRTAIEAGAAFIVSPGLDEGVIETAAQHDIPVFPGAATATEVQKAWNLGIKTVKFFPAELAGGTAMLRALTSVFRGVQFMPTGGVSAKNLTKYLAVPSVLACGGSWLTPAAAIEAGDFRAITQLAEEAVAIAGAVRNL